MIKLLLQIVLRFGVIFSDLFVNIGAKDFPEYHKLRIKFNLINLILEIYFCFLTFSLYYGLDELFLILLIFLYFVLIFSMVGIYYLIKSVYFYLAYDGFHRIKNPAIHILMCITSISSIILIFRLCSAKNKNNKSKKEIKELKTISTESNNSKIETKKSIHESNESQNESKVEINESSNNSDKGKILVYNN